MNIKRHEIQIERGYRALCLAAKELMGAMHRTALKDVAPFVKKNGGFRSSYTFEHRVRGHMGDTPGTRFLGDTLFEVVRKIQSYRDTRRAVSNLTALERRYFESANELRSVISRRRVNSTPDTTIGTSTKVLDHAINVHKYWSPKIQVSPAWLMTVNKLGGMTVSKDRVILTARYGFRIDEAMTVYSGTVLDIKSRSTKNGWIIRWQNGEEVVLKFGEGLEGSISRMRTSIMNSVMEEMRLV